MPEVGILRIDRHAAPLPALAAERRHLMHLIDERGDVLLLRLRDRVAQLDQLRIEILYLLGVDLRFAFEQPSNRGEALELLSNDLAAAVRREAGKILVFRPLRGTVFDYVPRHRRYG